MTQLRMKKVVPRDWIEVNLTQRAYCHDTDKTSKQDTAQDNVPANLEHGPNDRDTNDCTCY